MKVAIFTETYFPLSLIHIYATGVKIFAEARKAIGSCNGAAAAARFARNDLFFYLSLIHI